MGCNKRYFDMAKLAMYYQEDPKSGIEKCVGKADTFFFADDESARVVKLWSNGKVKEANNLIKKYVSRITSSTS